MKALLAGWALNSALTFQNRWPTAGVRWVAEFSVELAALLLALALVAARRGAPGRATRRALVGGYCVLVLGRYLDVTAPALLGRSVNLYWDLGHAHHVAAMFVASVAGWRLALAGSLLLAGSIALIWLLDWAFRAVLAALAHPWGRRGVAALAASLLALYGAGRLSPTLETERWFALPVAGMLSEQGRLALAATVLRDRRGLAAWPPLPDSNVRRLRGGDLFVLFFESYGALVFDDPRFAAPLASEFAALERSLADAGWKSASARVESSTFGGLSWLAHSSLLSGARIADQSDYRDLLASDRDTLVRRFAAAGYRTVAVMPGLKFAWPEGVFYGFDAIYDARSLDYRGPAYGWWAIPDQYSLRQVHRLEVEAADHRPLFVFFPTINSHAPFAPLPPYQADWSRFDRDFVPDDAPGSPTLAERLEGQELAAAYIQSIRYNLKLLEGYVRQHAPPGSVLVALGDHQPPAVVGGRELPWQVPVHLFSRDPELIERWLEAGFRPGLTPGPGALGGIESLGPLLLRALDSDAARAAAH
ncbi:MAG: sulfatase-like hydrolase/transferase [Candidatus Competibacter sp.]|nr:sulfatase-like hydrolase/transferase [Candidatus Competibacter sp.]